MTIRPVFEIEEVATRERAVLLSATLPPKDCVTCEHTAGNRDGGHCYMFEVEPESDVCGQYEAGPLSRQ